MNKLLIFTLCLMLAGSASALVTTFIDDFGGPAGTLDPGWTDNGPSPTTYNGAGVASYNSVIDDQWSISHDIGTGDWQATLSMNNFLTAGFSQFYLHLNDPTGSTGQQIGFKTWANVIYVENIDAVTFAGPWVTDALAASAVTSFDMVVDYTQATGDLSMNYQFNGGAVQNLLATYAPAGDALRNLEIRTTMWGTTYNAGGLSTTDLDYFSVVAPEPATIALLGLGGILLRRRRS